MEKATSCSTKKSFYYIPHHAVFKENSQTTKMWIVLDSSSLLKGENAFNDVLHQGPQFIPEMNTTLFKARTKVVYSLVA